MQTEQTVVLGRLKNVEYYFGRLNISKIVRTNVEGSNPWKFPNTQGMMWDGHSTWGGHTEGLNIKEVYFEVFVDFLKKLNNGGLNIGEMYFEAFVNSFGRLCIV